MSNTHYGVIVFSGDPAGEHPDVDLCGTGPSALFVACGPEAFCWEALVAWTAENPLRLWEEAEVLTRNPALVEDQEASPAAYRSENP